MKIYKIKRISDGLYSTGGQWPTFTKTGKNWTGLGPLKNHLHIVESWYDSHPNSVNVYTDCVVEVFDLLLPTEISLESFKA